MIKGNVEGCPGTKRWQQMEAGMEAYTGFAQVYDLFMDNTPYEEWGAFILERLKEEGFDSGLVLDLGC
ncbi:MAG: hypothetical protein PUF12_08190, partial [Thermoflexaceae bacterium]|nr:hypothetical protein [Thermoflexaceae bacterium]